MKTLHLPLVALLVIAFLPVHAFAQDTGAKADFAQGERDYAAGRYEKAAEAYQRAFDASQKPALLFNLANAYERMRAFEKAASALRRYLKTPGAQNRQLLSERIGRLEASAEQQKKDRSELMKAKLASASAKDTSGDAPAKARRSNLIPYILIGTGVAVVGGGVVLGLLASGKHSDAEKHCQGGICKEAAKDDLDSEKSLALGADLMFGVGLVAAGVGVTLLVLNMMSSGEKAPEAASSAKIWFEGGPLPSGGGIVGLGGRF